ncbi:MAG: contractile injection system tape measure protein [Bacteroidota bacterium]
MSQRHSIHSQHYEITSASMPEARQHQDVVSKQLHGQLMETMQSVFDEYATTDRTLKIDKLTLDLGEFNDRQFVANAPKALKEALLDQLWQIAHQSQWVSEVGNIHTIKMSDGQATVKIEEERDRMREGLKHFLIEGHFPWWMDKKMAAKWLSISSDSRAEATKSSDTSLLRSRFLEAFRGEDFQKLLEREQVRKRLIHQFPADWVAELYRALYPTHASFVGSSIEWLEHTAQKSTDDTLIRIASCLRMESFHPQQSRRIPANLSTAAVREYILHLISKACKVSGFNLSVNRLQHRFFEVLRQHGPTEMSRDSSHRAWQQKVVAGLRVIPSSGVQKDQAIQKKDPTSPSRAAQVDGFDIPPATRRMDHDTSQDDTPSDRPTANTPDPVVEDQQSTKSLHRAEHLPKGNVWQDDPSTKKPKALEDPLTDQVYLKSDTSAQGGQGHGGDGDQTTYETRPPQAFLGSHRPQEGEVHQVDNAGLVLLWPYLPRFMEAIGLVKDGEFALLDSRIRAVLILQCLVADDDSFPEHELLLNKVLCGLPLDEPVPSATLLTSEEKEEVDHLLAFVLQQWKALKSTRTEALRETFLCREGLLKRAAQGWTLQVERTTFDVLLDRLPWGYSLIKLPWLDEMIHVEW